MHNEFVEIDRGTYEKRQWNIFEKMFTIQDRNWRRFIWTKYYLFWRDSNIEVEIDEIINELKTLKCISKKSEIIGETIQIYLTLDGITYFSKQKINENGITINFNGDQINVVTDNGRIDAKNYEKDIDNIPKTIVVEGNKNSREASSGESEINCFG